MEKIHYDLKSMKWVATFVNCYVEDGANVRGLTKTINIIENHGNIFTENLTSKIAEYDLWGGRTRITLDGPPQRSHIQIDISHEDFRGLNYIMKKLRLIPHP